MKPADLCAVPLVSLLYGHPMPSEAELKSAESVELELAEFVAPQPFQDAPRPDAAALRILAEVAQEMAQSPGLLPEAAVSDFPAPMMTVMFTPHKLAKAAARQAIEAALAKSALPWLRGLKVERVTAGLRPTFFPRWFLQGAIRGDWSAQGTVVETWETDCSRCVGSGRVGIGTQQQDCPSCWGSGKEKQSRKERHGEKGQGDVALLESLDNNGTGVPLTFAVQPAAIPLLLPDEERLRLRCLRPAGIYSSALDGLKNQLASSLEAQARASMAQYSRIEAFRFEPESVTSQSAVAAWLYPVYLASFAAPGGMGHVLCDAQSGAVHWAQADVASAGQKTDGAWWLSSKVLAIGGLVLAALVAGVAGWWHFSRS
jgi:hypothetical protein